MDYGKAALRRAENRTLLAERQRIQMERFRKEQAEQAGWVTASVVVAPQYDRRPSVMAARVLHNDMARVGAERFLAALAKVTFTITTEDDHTP